MILIHSFLCLFFTTTSRLAKSLRNIVQGVVGFVKIVGNSTNNAGMIYNNK
ncbi:hypothetical protein Bccel_3261 [Pseudobacteroides cellulosolvens ATCC 35603 = DSM 2933]|uniref:Uncharacterized protein n=1 Tax=Pseudobacteroides cellulosolvens ATCC 35603 = DSM 2933 TaxID=398512 RepID=A0A0L6JQM1_9FIRM|nr:hypothetical protein Bccel_3261 [Pseudobacteroides cellulosolvens ATCC 35603 = DSM 2933]